MEEVFKEGLVAIIPKYIEQKGNCTVLYGAKSGPRLLEKSIKTTIRLVGKYYMIDLSEVKKRYKSIILTSNLMPIPLSKQDILIPVKTRKPMVKNDGAFGYVNIRYIKGIKKFAGSTNILLQNGISIECLCNPSTWEKHLRNGRIMSRCYEERVMGVAEEQERYKACIPASKADIAMVLREIKEQYKGQGI